MLRRHQLPYILDRGYAGIDRQLHPLKVKDLMKTGVVKFKRKNIMLSYAYKSKSLKLAKSTVLLLGKYQYNEGALESVVNCIPWSQRLEMDK